MAKPKTLKAGIKKGEEIVVANDEPSGDSTAVEAAEDGDVSGHDESNQGSSSSKKKKRKKDKSGTPGSTDVPTESEHLTSSALKGSRKEINTDLEEEQEGSPGSDDQGNETSSDDEVSSDDDDHLANKRKHSANGDGGTVQFIQVLEPMFLKGLKEAQVADFEEHFRLRNAKDIHEPSRTALINVSVQNLLEVRFLANKMIKDVGESELWSDEKWFANVRLCNVGGQATTANISQETLESQLIPIKLMPGDMRNDTALDKFESMTMKVLDRNDLKTWATINKLPKEKQTAMIAQLVKNMGCSNPADNDTNQIELIANVRDGGLPKSLFAFFAKLRAAYEALLIKKSFCVKMKWDQGGSSRNDKRKHGERDQEERGRRHERDRAERDQGRDRDRDHGRDRDHEQGRDRDHKSKKDRRAHDEHPPKAADTRVKITGDCWGCGAKGHKKEDCPHKDKPDFNKESCPWATSKNGIRLKKDSKKDSIQGESDILDYICASVSLESNDELVPMCFQVERSRMRVRALVDTGALRGNYINVQTAQWLEAQGVKKQEAQNGKICSGFTDVCREALGIYLFEINFINEETSKEELMIISASAIESPFALILGRPAIREYDLVDKLRSQFRETLQTKDSVERGECGVQHTSSTLCTKCAECSHASDQPPRTNLSHVSSLESSIRPPTKDAEPVEYGKKIKLSSIWTREPEDYDEISDEDDWYQDGDQDSSASTFEDSELPRVCGDDPIFKEQILDVCREYKDVFSTTLREEPALLPPMVLNVDAQKWYMPRNRRPYRLQTVTKQDETRRQIEKMLANNVIRESQATAHSQVLLTPKPQPKNTPSGGEEKAETANPLTTDRMRYEVIMSRDQEIHLAHMSKEQLYRFCVDYRVLNDATEGMGWPIPNVPEMFERLGAQGSDYFGVMDLTSGYHQAPLSECSRAFTAFITHMGLFEWLRVPMGLKGAPSWFQQIIATIVLAGLLYIICELYMDDIIMHARTQAEFLIRLRAILERFRKHKLTANPKKCRLGQRSAEYVGRMVDREGLHFSAEKLDGVMDFPKPVFGKQMKSFLGLCNYFRDHVDHHSDLVKPLGDMIIDYEKTRTQRLHWTVETTATFEKVKLAIHRCQKLFFIDSTAPIYLHTDASKYGVGGYLFQVVDGKEQPIRFISKTLVKEQQRWSVPEKEGYAIWYSLKKLEHLIRDVHFTLRTDHKNLIYINEGGSEKVRRWKMDIQAFDFDLEYIPGPDNVVADHFSRLVEDTSSLKPSKIPTEVLACLCPLDSDDIDEYLCPIINGEFKIPHERFKTIAQVHNSRAGHHGVEMTLKKLDDKAEQWTYRREHVKKFVRECPLCQKMSCIRIPIHTNPFSTTTFEPHERINIDTIGPLPPDEDGNRHIIVIRDTFTRWIELYPVKTTDAEHAAHALLQHFGTFGCPSQVLSDNGSQFVNAVIEEFMKLVGTQHELTLAYSKEENGLVERANKEVMRHLRALIYEAKDFGEWSKLLPFVKRIMNASKVASIGVSAAELLFGNAISLDRGIFMDQKDGAGTASLSARASKMLAAQQKLMEVAQRTQHRINDAHIVARDAERLTEFAVGSFVLREYPPSGIKKGPPNKFMTNLRGPYRVEGWTGATYTLKNMVTQAKEKEHVTRLKPFVYDKLVTNPTEVAMHDNREFVIDSIIAHRGDPRYKARMEFLVRWVGYGPEDDSWEPWSGPEGQGVSKTTQLHAYLREHGMARLIPKIDKDDED